MSNINSIIAHTPYGSKGHIGEKHSPVGRRGRGVFGYSFSRWFGRFWKKEWEYIFDAIMGVMVMLGCGILSLIPCDSVIPLRKLAEDVGVTHSRKSIITARNCSGSKTNCLPPFVLKDM